MRDEDEVVVVVGSWAVHALANSDLTESLAMRKGLEFANDLLFLNLAVE